MRSKGGCSGVRSAVSEPGRIPLSPTLRSMGHKATRDTGTAAEESVKRDAGINLLQPHRKQLTFTIL